MSDQNTQIERLKLLCPNLQIWAEGGLPLVYLPDLQFYYIQEKQKMDALLCPRARDNYASRLFFAKPLNARGQNWNAFNICGRTWHACSWQGVPATLPWIEILAGHLSVLL